MARKRDIEHLDTDEKGRWYVLKNFKTIELVIISAWASLYFGLIIILGSVARIFLPAPPLFLIPVMFWGTYLFVLIALIIRKKGTMLVFGVPMAILFAVSPAQTGFPHWFKVVSIVIVNGGAELALILLHKHEKIASAVSGAVIGLAIFFTFIITVAFFEIQALVDLSVAAAYFMVPAGIILGALGGLGAYLTYGKIKRSAVIMRIRTWG